jgi:hypothetical protein
MSEHERLASLAADCCESDESKQATFLRASSIIPLPERDSTTADHPQFPPARSRAAPPQASDLQRNILQNDEQVRRRKSRREIR